MAWFLYLVSAAWIAFGACTILYTTETRRMAKDLLFKTNRTIMASIPAIAGILFILSASASGLPWVMRLFGILGLLKGGFIYVNPQDLYNKTTTWYLETISDQAHRFFGIITIILGTAVFSWVI